MDILVSIGISVGLLAGAFAQGSGPLGIITWVGFVSWACFYAAGGKVEGLIKTIPSNLSGVFWAYMIMMGATTMNFSFALGIAVAVGAFLMCVQAKIKYLSFIPGTFAGCSCLFGTNGDIKGTVIALVLGAVLGYISEYLGGMISKIPVGKKAS